MGGLGKHLSHQDREILDREGIDSFTRPKGWKKVCANCGSWTGRKGDGNYRCYAGDCPAKARDDAAKPKRRRGRHNRRQQ